MMILEIKSLIKNEVLVEGKKTTGTIKNNDISVYFEALKDSHNSYIKLNYVINDYYGKKHTIIMKIHIEIRKSNLGIGEILLFNCPFCFKSCRKLLMVNYCINFKCRKCYSTLPYPTQNSSKMWRSNSQFFNVKNRLERLYEMRYSETYNGKKTKRAKRIELLEQKLEKYNYLRFMPSTIPLKLRRIVFNP